MNLKLTKEELIDSILDSIEILDLMSDFEKYLNDTDTWHDPLINIALLHYQFDHNCFQFQ